jgi:hypothetical protein
MTKNRHPLTADDSARIEPDAAAFLAYLAAHGRPGFDNTMTVVRPRVRMARALGLTIRQFGRAEAYLAARHLIGSQSLLPRNEWEAAEPHFRWILRSTPEGIQR